MRRNIRLLYLHSFLSDFAPHWPYQVIFFQQITGSYTLAMGVVALETLSAAFLDIPTGVMSDRIGRKKTIAIGSLSAALGLSLYAMAHGVSMLSAGAVLVGLSQCLFSGNNNAMLFETLQAEGQQERFAHYRAGTGMMFQLGLCLSAFSAIPLSLLGLRAVFVAATIPQALAIPVTLLMRETSVRLVEKRGNLKLFVQACQATWRNPKLLSLVCGKGITYGAGEATFKFEAAFVALVWPSWALGVYRGISHGICLIGFIVSRHMPKQIKPLHVFLFRSVYDFLSVMAGLLMSNIASPILFCSREFLFGPSTVASDQLMQREFTDEQRATMGSLASSVSSVVFAIASIGIGAVSDRFGIAAGMSVGVVLMLLALPIYLRLFRREA